MTPEDILSIIYNFGATIYARYDAPWTVRARAPSFGETGFGLTDFPDGFQDPPPASESPPEPL